MGPLLVPPETNDDPRATEMIRVWLAREDLHVSLNLGMWEDADDTDIDEREAWGTLLSDIARHIANGLKQSHNWKEKETLAKIKKAFLENIANHERQTSGSYVPG